MSTENKFYKLRRGGSGTPSQREDKVEIPKSESVNQTTKNLNIVQEQAANKVGNETPTKEQKNEAKKGLEIASQENQGRSVEETEEAIDALATGLDGSISTEEDAPWRSRQEMVLEGLTHFAPFKVSELKIGSADWAKEVGKSINMETYSKAERYADAMMTTADENDIQKGMESILKDFPVDELVSEDYILGKVKTKDKEGNPVYVFNGKVLYGDDTAHKIAEAYAKQHNHSIKLKDEEYREAWAKEQGAPSFQAYIEGVNKTTLQPIYQELVKAFDAYYAENKDAIDAARLASSYAPVPIPTEANTLGAMVAELSLQTDAFVNPTFWRGVASGGVEALRIASGDMSEIFHSAETIAALKKYQDGEELNAKENLLVKMFAYSNLLDQTKSELRKGLNAADIGSGFVTGVGYSANMLREGLVLGGGLAGAFAKKAIVEAAETAVERSVKQALTQGLKKYGKEALWGVVDDAIRTPFKAQTWTEFANRRLNQYQFNDGVLMYNESNPLADMYRAYATVFGERASERLGDFINDGVGLFGRSVAQSRFTRSLFGGKVGKAVDWVSEWKPAMAVAQGLKYARIQGLAGEYLSERANEYLQPMLTGEYFTTLRNGGYMAAYNKHYAPILSSESALTTLAVCGAISGTGYFANFVGGLKTGVEIASLRKETRQIINSISNPTIRNAVYSAISTNDYSGLASINWKEAYKNNDAAFADDATRVTNAVFNSAKIQARKGELAETERLETFLPAVESALASVYRGADMANPTPTMEVIRAFSVDQKSGQVTPVGNVLFGDIDNKQGIVQVVDRTGVIRDIPVESLQFTRTSMTDFLAEQYDLMFSTSIAKERLNDIIENVRGAAEMDYETYAEILADGGFSVYERGDEVSLTDGRDGTIQSVADNGKYVVQTTDANGKPVTILVGFESILSEFNDDMAEAQIEASDEGLIDAPIVLPTKQDGSISLDEMDDAQAIADVLPAVVGVGTAEAAVEVIDSEISRLKEEQRKTSSKSVGLDAMVEAKQKAEATTKRIGVLTEARNILMDGIAKPAESETDVDATTEERENHRKRVEAEYDAMSTFDFSRDYRNRMVDSKASRNALWTFVNNIKKALGVSDEAIADIDKKISEVQAQIGSAYETATSEADMERIAEQTIGLKNKLEELNKEKAEVITERKVLEHRKAQYEQTLKDMGGDPDAKYQEGTIGADKRVFKFAEKASEILGMPIVVTEKEFTSNRQNGLHRVDENGKSVIYINPNSTTAEQGVGILAHEIGHEFKKVLTPEEWAKFEDLVLTARFGKDWANSEAYKKEIEGIQNAEKSVNGQGISDPKAREEVVTYALQTFIFDGERGARAFEAILNQDLNWRDKLMEALRKVVDKLKALFNEQDLAVQSAIEEFGNIFKRYAQKSGEIKAEQIEGETAAIINEKDGQSSFSLSTYEDGGRDILQNFLNSQVEGGKLEQKDANAILTEMDAIYDICMDYKDEYAPFGAWSDAAVVRDGEGMPVFSVIKANGDYAMNLDFSLVCKKRRTLDAVLNEMIGRKLIEIAPDDPTFIAKVNDIVRKYGFETACRLCFVDAKRFRVVSTARNFCKLYNGVVAKLMPTDKKVAINSFDAAGVGYPTHESSLDTLADSELNIKALEDILKRNGEKTVIAKIARHLLEHPEDRKLVHISDFVSTRGFDPTKALNPQILSLYNSKKGSGGPKASFSDVQYLNDVIYADWNKEDAYAVGGVRVQSFSDYVPRMVFDYMQMVADLAAKQMPVHAYTKEAAFAKTFGLTGMKINMSLVPTVVEGGIAAGLDADGNYAWEEGETFDYDTAIEIQNADGYRENCGTIAVGVSDEHIDKMLDDDNIRMVIPYHKSGLNKAVAIANNIDAFKDYTNQQNTRYADGTKLSSADSKNVPNFNEDTRRLGDPRKAADAYLAWCKENNYKPKFDKWASHPNYYKLLEDFTTLVDGEYFEQRSVTMTFPKEGDAFGSLSNLIAESLEEDAVLEGKRDSLVGAMVDEIESTLFSNREKALESSNSLQKQPNTQEVVTDADVVEESFSISRNNEATIDKWLGKREDFTDEVKNAFKEYIADFKPATQLATTKWFANGVIRIPEDMPKVEQAMEIAQRKKVDALQYNSPMELIEQFGVVAPKEKLINPDDVPTLSNKTQVPNTDITIYDVDDSEESRKNFRELMNSHLGKESSPWCLLQADKNGVLTKESARYWKHYNRYPKRAAFNNGKLIAFFASDGEPTWWDRMDQPHSEIPIVGKIKGDALGRTATMLVSENGEVVGYTDIHKGNKIDGLYEEWYDLEHIHRRGTFKNAQREGIFEQWHSNGVRQSYAEFENNMEHRLSEQWDYDGELIKRRVNSEDAQIIGQMDKSPLTHAKTRLALTNFDKPHTISMIWNELTGVPARIENNLPDGVERWDVYDWRQSYINTQTQKQYDWTKLEFISHNGGYGISDYTSTSMSESVEFEDGVKYEKKNRGFDRYISDIYNLEVGEKTFIATISTDGEHKKISISRKIDTRYAPFATIEDGKRSMPMGIKDTEVDAVLAEVENRLDAINKMALDVQEDAKREKARAEKIREKFNSKNIPDIETVEDVDKMLEQISNDLASTKDSFSIDRSQYLEGIKDEEYRDWTRGKLYQIEEAVKNGLDVRLGYTISTYDKYAKKEERKAKRAKTDWDKNNAEQKVASYRAITEYGRAMMKEHFPEFIANAHTDNIKSGNATLSYIEELFNKYNKNEDTAELFKVVMKTAKQIGTKVRFETLRDGSRLGEQRANLIKYDVDAMNSDTISDESKATTLLHELIHAVTASGILLVEQPSLMIRTGVTPSAQLKSAVRRLKRTFDSIKKDEAFKGTYGSTSYEEMLAELANPKFAEKLKAHDIWVRVINGIREVVLAIASIVTGKDYKTSAYAELRDTLTEIIEETPMEFVGYINIVRDKTIAKNYMEVESVEELAEPRTEQESYSILREENTDTIFATAKEEFASTNDWKKTGWLMPDGTQLDFAEGGDYRGTDHRAIGAAYKGKAEHQWQYLQDFESRGGIRIHMNRDGKYGTIEMTIKPTAEQKKRLRSFIGAVGGNVDVDFMDENYNTAHSASYEGVSPARVLSGITSFYDEGIKPKGNVSYSVARLPKAEYAILSSEIMTRQHTYHRPPFDYAYTSGKFYVYDYLGDGDFIIKFALPIVEEYKEAISLISKAIDNGTINSTRSLDTFLETTRSGKGDDIIDLVDVLKERAWYQGVSIPMSSRQGRKARGVSNVGNSDSTTTSSRGTNRRGVSLENSTEDSYSLNRTDIDYLDAVNRGDMVTAQKMVNETAENAGFTIRAYHGTDKGGFTVFENSQSDDRLSFFFTDNWTMASSYSKEKGDINLGDDVNTIREAKSLIEDFGYYEVQKGYTVDGEDIYDSPEDLLKDWELEEGETIKEVYNVRNTFEGYSISEGWVNEDEVIKIARTFVRDESENREQSGIYDVRLKFDNPMVIDAKGANWDSIYIGEDVKYVELETLDLGDDEVELHIGISPVDGDSIRLGGTSEVVTFASWDDLYDYVDKRFDEEVAEWVTESGSYNAMFDFKEQYVVRKSTTREIAEDASAGGHDGVIIHNLWDNGPYAERQGVSGTVYIVFDANHIKSTNPVTYDDKGNIIPLSERFNTKEDDIRYSLNLDDEIIATPEMEAEANEELELSGEQQLMLMYAMAESRFQKYKEKARKQRTKTRMSKNAVIAEVQRILKDKSFKEGALNVSSGQYNKIVENVLNTIKKLPEDKEFKLEDVYYEVINNLTSARLASADAALKKAENDFKTTITKKRFAKNAKGEIIQKYVDGNVQKMMEQFVGVIEHLFTHDGKVDWRKVHTIAEKNSSELDKAIAEYGDKYATEGDESSLGIYNLLLLVKDTWNAASELEDVNKAQKDTDTDIKETEATLLNIEELLNTYNGGGREMGKAKRELKAMGYTIAQAEKAIDQLRSQLEELAKEKKAMARGEVNAKTKLIETIKVLNTGILSLDKLGRIALKEWNAERAEEKRVFRNGVLRSIRNPLFRNTIDYNEKDKTMKDESGKEYSRRMYRKLRRRGDSVFSDITDTFDQITRKADVMSIPDAWLHSGFRYQFMLHPEKGAIARADWRYKTERGIRKTLDEKIKSVVGKKVGWERRFKNLLNEEIAHYEVVKTNSDGTIPNSADTTRHTFTVNEALYIRAAIRQDGVLRGYLTTGLTEDQVNDMVALVERKYASLCALCDWVQSEGGIMEQLYQMRNEEYKRLNGIDLPHTEQYYPIKRKADTIASEDSVGDTIPVSNLANGIGSNKARVRNNVAMDLNAGFFDVLDSHISESVQWTAYADLFDKMNTLLRSPMFKRMCKVQGLSIENLKNAFMRATGETLGRKESHWMAKLVTSATKSAVASNVAFNLNSALKQMASATMALSRDVNPELWAHFVKNFPIVSYLSTIADKPWRNYKNDSTSQFWSVVFPNIKWAYENIPTFAERFHSDNIGLDIFKADGFETWDKISGAIKKIGMSGNKFMDLVASSAITKSIYEFEYKKNRRRGLSHEDAHNDARITAAVFMNQTQQSDQGAFLSSVQSDRKGLSGALVMQGLTAYQNSQLGFDRNARYAMISLIDLTTDGANDQRIAYLTKEYEDRGLSHKKASKFAKRDLRVAILTQLNSFIHNTFVNAALWSIMPTAIVALTSYFVGEDDDERDELTLQKMVDEAVKKALSRSFVYLVPGTSQPIIKRFVDIYVDRGLTGWTNFDRDRAFGKDVSVGYKPLYDLFNEGQRLVSAYLKNEKFGGEKMKLELEAAGTTFGFALLDTATRYGFGLSTETIRRMFNGFVGAYKDGNVEDWMNATTQSKTLTKLMAGRPRKGEEMEDYIERVGGMYKVINGFNKGVDESKLRKEYIERMDELLLHSNGMDYNKLKEDLKLVGDIAKERVIVTVREAKDEWGNVIIEVKPKEGYTEEYESITDEEAGHQEALGTIKYVITLVNKDLKDTLCWDEETASYRLKYYKELQGELDKFLKEFADYREYENNNKE